MIHLVTLWIAAILARDAGHDSLANFGIAVLILCTFLWSLGLLVSLFADD